MEMLCGTFLRSKRIRWNDSEQHLACVRNYAFKLFENVGYGASESIVSWALVKCERLMRGQIELNIFRGLTRATKRTSRFCSSKSVWRINEAYANLRMHVTGKTMNPLHP